MKNTVQHTIAEFTSSRPGISELIGSKLDNSQYIALLFKGEAERIKDKVSLGSLVTPKGKKYNVSVAGQPVITDSDGRAIAHPGELKPILESNREKCLHYDSLSFLEVEGETPHGKRYMGVFYSLADAQLYLGEESEKGEL
ncbi:MAG: hypothetical protein Q8O88_03575 [bacterium]|nr:hypothetical protein [bacterium]